MPARPSFYPAIVTVNSFDTSLSAGKVLANFTANTTNGNTVAFTLSTLTPGKRYMVNVSGKNVDNPVADNDGVIRFSHSDWPADVFTVVEDASYELTQSRGNAMGKSIYVNQTLLLGANVTLYYNNGTSYGQTVLSGSSGSFEFKNVSVGSYYVIIEKQLFAQNQSSLKINANMTTDIGSRSLMFLDVNGNKKIDVLDLDMLIQNLGAGEIINCPACDINSDGNINILDGNQIAQNI
jgi:hypothetical protein